jgi:thiamine-phosphate pyrophosphorylase
MQEPFGLYLILTNPVAGYAACAEAAIGAGVRFLQLRVKDKPRTAILKTACEMRAITRGTGTRFIVNDHLSVAIESDADGLHMGQDDDSLLKARDTWNTSGKIFGLSTHSQQQAQGAQDAEPDYIGVGPVFSTPTKINAAPALGIAQTSQIIDRSPIPAVAIGGIDADNLPDLLRAGIQNFCVVRAVNDAEDPVKAIRHLQEIYGAHRF